MTDIKKKILLAHGGGGSLSRELIEKLVLENFPGKVVHRLEDSAVFSHRGERLAFTTDSFVVQPLFFPGGDIGRLAVAGTVNDLVSMGAEPLYLTLGFIVEEGLDYEILERIMLSIRRTTEEAGIELVGGDLKVVERGSADKIFINSSGIGLIKGRTDISAHNARPGDKIILSGTIAEHGLTILGLREKLSFTSQLKSDCAPLSGLVKKIHKEINNIHVMRDPTRGGVAAVLNEIAGQSKAGMIIEERNIPVRNNVKAAADLLGLDLLNIPNEGKLIIIVKREAASRVISLLHRHSRGKKAAIIGEITKFHPGMVILKTKIGGERIIDMPPGEELPRIC